MKIRSSIWLIIFHSGHEYALSSRKCQPSRTPRIMASSFSLSSEQMSRMLNPDNCAKSSSENSSIMQLLLSWSDGEMVGQVVECPFPQVPRVCLKGATGSGSKGAADGREANIEHGSSCKDEWRSDGGSGQLPMDSSGDMAMDCNPGSSLSELEDVHLRPTERPQYLV